MPKSNNSDISFLRLEGLAIFVASLWAYFQLAGGEWFLLGLLILAPDVFMFGYIFNNRTGAFVYNLGHNLVVPVFLLYFGWHGGEELLYQIGLIWTAHIGLDRVLGFGLKTDQGFRYTNLGKIGRK